MPAAPRGRGDRGFHFFRRATKEADEIVTAPLAFGDVDGDDEDPARQREPYVGRHVLRPRLRDDAGVGRGARKAVLEDAVDLDRRLIRVTTGLASIEGLFKLGVKLTADYHVVAPEDGEPLQPRSLRQMFRKFLRARSLKAVRLHDLRHSHATAMLKAGVHPKVAQERLGHSSVGVTIDLYSHVIAGHAGRRGQPR